MAHPSNNRRLAVSIVTFRTPEEEMRMSLQSLIEADVCCRIDVIDNAAEDSMRRLANDYGEKVTYTANTNVGYGSGHNISLRRSMAADIDYHLVLNSDVLFEPSILQELLDYMDSHPEAGQLIPHTVYPDGRRQPVCHPLPSPLDLIIRRFMPPGWFRRHRRRYNMLDLDMSVPLNVPFHHGCFMLLRIDALRDKGIFDERYFMYAEDIDLTRRIHAGWQTIYYPDVTVVHAHRAASRHSLRMLVTHSVNMLRYFSKWGFIADSERKAFNERLFRAHPRKSPKKI